MPSIAWYTGGWPRPRAPSWRVWRSGGPRPPWPARDLEPVGSMAMHRYGEQVGDLDAAVQAAIDAGIGSQIGSLVRMAVTRATGEPARLS